MDGRADRRTGSSSFPGDDHYIFIGNQDELLDEIERFVTEVRGEEADLDRVLATALFTDIVDSTVPPRAGARAGERLVERHHGLVRASRRFAAPRSIPRAT